MSIREVGASASIASAELIKLTAEIASAYVAGNHVRLDELAGVMEAIHTGLKSLGGPRPAPEQRKAEPAVSIKKSVTPEYIVSLEDGKQYKSMKRHLARRGMTPQQYRDKWGLPHDYPMVAATYAAKRSEMAKAIGLGGKKASLGLRGIELTPKGKPPKRYQAASVDISGVGDVLRLPAPSG